MADCPDSPTTSLSKLSINSSEDWDRSLNLSDSDMESIGAESGSNPNGRLRSNTATPRNSVVFPANGDNSETPGRSSGNGKGKRSLSDLLRLHAEKGTTAKFSPEEAARIADVLNSWVNTSPSPYEDEDDFFARSQDDISIRGSRPPSSRSRGQSESAANSRPPSAAGSVKT